MCKLVTKGLPPHRPQLHVSKNGTVQTTPPLPSVRIQLFLKAQKKQAKRHQNINKESYVMFFVLL
uniref:Uncharacterized protein n=1 Tax=Anguilla anguilla TaxID=7936 RepID=A0A0E9XH85_ANGAN